MENNFLEGFMQLITADGNPMLGTTIIPISQEDLDGEVESVVSKGDWNIQDAIDEVRKTGEVLKQGTKKLVRILYVAKSILKNAENKEKYGMDFNQFCDKCGITLTTANRWIREWRDPEGVAESKVKAKDSKADNIVRDRAPQTINRMGVSITKEEDDFIEIEINYMGQIFYKKLKR